MLHRRRQSCRMAAMLFRRGLLILCVLAVLLSTRSRLPAAQQGSSAPAPDLAARLAKFRRVEMPFHSVGLTSREQQMVAKLVEASGYLEDIYWRQSDPEGLAL